MSGTPLVRKPTFRPNLYHLPNPPAAPDLRFRRGAGRRLDRAALALVILGALALAVIIYSQYLHIARYRWDSAVHDRNAHYLLGLNLALDARHGDVRAVLSDLDGAHTWPGLLHGLLEAAVLLIGGVDYRLAVLPSLAGWAGTVVLGFLIARRMVSRGGNLAGLVAVVFILASPAHRAFATDTMLESLGACLSLLALYCYLAAVQGTSPWPGRFLGLALTALFLNKYNYWVLVVASLLATAFLAYPKLYWRLFTATVAGIDWRRGLRGQLHQPLNYALAGVLTVLAVVVLRGGQQVHVGDNRVSLHSPHNLVHLVYAIVFFRAVWWWRTNRLTVLRHLDFRTRPVVGWHVLPVAVWFLLPKRLGYWLWFLGPSNVGQTPTEGVGAGLAFYARSLVGDYHLALGSAVLAAGLLAVALVSVRRLQPGARAVLVFVLLAAAMTVLHPQRKSRYVHSWIAAGWVAGGAGLASLLLGGMGPARGRIRPLLGSAAVAGLALAHWPGLLMAGHSPERGHHDLGASTLDLSDAYLPLLADGRRTAFFSTMEIKYFLRWTYLEHFGRRDGIEVDLRGFGADAAESSRVFGRWLETTACDHLVFIDVPAGSTFHELTAHNEAFAAQVPQFLASQDVFRLTYQRAFPQYGCAVNLYTRRPHR